MEEILIATLIGWILTRSLDKKSDQPAPESPAAIILTPGYSQKLGKSIMPWPSVIPGSAGAFAKLFTTDENRIYPGAICQWPQKFQVRDRILQSFIWENQLAAQWSRLSPPDREGRAGDGIRDEIQAQKQLRKNLYDNLVTACGSYQAGSGGSSAAQTISPGSVNRTIVP